MILKNMFNALATVMVGYTDTPGLKCTNGSIRNTAVSYGNYATYTNLSNAMRNITNVTTGAGIVFGDGTSEPSLDDYMLKGNYFAGTGNVDFSYSFDDTGITYTAVCTLTNNTSEDFTVSEVGVQSGNSPTTVLIERTLLDEPITIPAGGIGVVTYTIKLN
jgi:hypothetical protein